MYTCTLNIISCGLVYNCRYPQYTLPAQDERYPESDLLEALQLTVEEADKCQMVAQQPGQGDMRYCYQTELLLDSSWRFLAPRCMSQVRTRGANTKYRLIVEEADKCQMVAQQLCSSQGKVT